MIQPRNSKNSLGGAFLNDLIYKVKSFIENTKIFPLINKPPFTIAPVTLSPIILSSYNKRLSIHFLKRMIGSFESNKTTYQTLALELKEFVDDATRK